MAPRRKQLLTALNHPHPGDGNLEQEGGNSMCSALNCLNSPTTATAIALASNLTNLVENKNICIFTF